ncbi:GGDEF domain-containing protein [Tumebacillus algifaecis]|uniref:GGDEF domain-containing protein n=1 Tax=Tumebacillus algifaecis TaxID=1214604 RepID=UPI0012FDA2D5|nr:GGDEF domain-containing protein [Tumebacillus algifaecis]
MTGTFLGAMITNASVLVSLVYLQQYVYLRFIEGKSERLRTLYGILIHGFAALLSMLFAYQLENGAMVDTRIVPLLLMFIWSRRYLSWAPYALAVLIILMRYGISINQGAHATMLNLLAITIVLGYLNSVWLSKQSFRVRVWTVTLIGSIINLVMASLVGAMPMIDFLEQFAAIFFFVHVVTMIVMVFTYRAIFREMRLHTELRETAETDFLTGLQNRRMLDRTLNHHLRLSSRTEAELSVALIDIDHFKRVNDTFGHEAGDEVLRRVAEIIKHNVRSYDRVGRYGGEEFMIVFPHLGKQAASEISERVRQEIEAAEFVTALGHKVQVTVSIGVATHCESRGNLLWTKADERLYQAKNRGRNRTVSAG